MNTWNSHYPHSVLMRPALAAQLSGTTPACSARAGFADISAWRHAHCHSGCTSARSRSRRCARPCRRTTRLCAATTTQSSGELGTATVDGTRSNHMHAQCHCACMGPSFVSRLGMQPDIARVQMIPVQQADLTARFAFRLNFKIPQAN